jgi:DNA-binding response OmpR family regulator
MRALVVEDDPGIAGGLSLSLRQAGYAVDVCGTLDSAWTALCVEPFDVMLLDLGLPDGDGLDLLAGAPPERAPARPVHAAAADMPVLIMTARDGVSDRISGLDEGADDYIVKPFDPNELLARLRAMLRRASGRSKPVIEYGEIWWSTRPPVPCERAGLPVALGGKEFALLLTLLQAKPQVLSKARLESALYGFGEALESNAIEVHVHHLRRKLGESLIKTVRGVGYFVPQEPPAAKLADAAGAP